MLSIFILKNDIVNYIVDIRKKQDLIYFIMFNLFKIKKYLIKFKTYSYNNYYYQYINS
jgi:hypothetical protein